MVNINELMKKLKSGIFPNHKNRIWTLCNVTTKMILKCVEEAEKYNMTNEQFYIQWQDILNKVSTKDPNNNEDLEIQEMFYKFHSDSGIS